MAGGRPILLNEELTNEIVELIETGAPIETCAQACGIAPRTLWDWLDRGIAGRSPYAEFSQAVARARAKAELKLLRRVAGEEDDPDPGALANAHNLPELLRAWHERRGKGAAWILERTRPERYAQRINVKVREAVSEVMEVVRGICTPEDFARICERLAGTDTGGSESAPLELAAEDLDS